MADQISTSAVKDLETTLNEPFQAEEILRLQTKFRTFYKNVVIGSVDTDETDKWCHYIQNSRLWNCIKNTVPELMIRE